MNLLGTYGGTVEANQDPEKLGRLKVRVPLVYGVTTGSGYIGTNDLPWALPAGMPAGGNSKSGGFSHIPEVGDSVWVRFLDGEPEKPVWEWGMQTLPQRNGIGGGVGGFKLHAYDPISHKPNRAVWTKYDHAVELNYGGIIATTSQGYQMVFTDATAKGSLDGSIKIATGAGNFFKFDDLSKSFQSFVAEDMTFNLGGDWLILADTATFSLGTNFRVLAFGSASIEATQGIDLLTSTDFKVDAVLSASLNADASFQISTLGPMTLNYGTSLSLGVGATQPLVLGILFETWATALLAWLTAHVHTSSDPGSPTSPPIVPPLAVVQPQVAQLLSQSIFGR